MDIWMSKLNVDGTYSQAVNAGDKINSQGNEVTPFYDVNNRKLFSAATGITVWAATIFLKHKANPLTGLHPKICCSPSTHRKTICITPKQLTTHARSLLPIARALIS